jgi:hypothetical protein
MSWAKEMSASDPSATVWTAAAAVPAGVEASGLFAVVLPQAASRTVRAMLVPARARVRASF